MIIDGIAAGRVLRPQSVEELADLTRSGSDSLVPVGAGTNLEFGNPLQSADCAVDLGGLDRITAYNPADLTVHVEAGVKLGHLLKELEARNQTLPLDPWSGPDATIGGLAATNAQGPFRAVGTLRDWIIGMRVVHADGRISKTGGRVVKNVTGYDLAKLYTGSLGSLAIVVEVSLKVRARYQKTATAVARFDRLDDALAIVNALRQGAFEPVACEVTGAPPAVWVRFGDDAQAVDWQIRNLPPAEWRVSEGDSEPAVWEQLRSHYHGMGPIVARVVAAPSAIGEILDFAAPAAWIVHAANGIALVAVSSPEDVRRLRGKFPVIVEKAPREMRRELPAFGVAGVELRIMKDLKRAFDPAGRLNRGRHIDGE
ncbi:MAG TPA: FAD-binding oxidoreductase [Terriglobia bacterium]|nr:FAD-binding oxidoreductase [Terriglobia bacterium]